MPITHSKVSDKADSANTSLIQPSDWNDEHVVDVSLTTDVSGILPAVNGGMGFYNVMEYGAVADGVTDDTDAFNAMWQDVVDSLTALTNHQYVSTSIVIPQGKYAIAGSINFTGLFAFNIHIHGAGAVLLGNGAGKNVLDMTACRGVHIHDLTIIGNSSSVPACGILMGPAGENTCGNSAFFNVMVMGTFTTAAVWNLGSETTHYTHCNFANSRASSSSFAYLADGLNRFSATSDYTALRSANVAVSFTNNDFISCSFRQYGTGKSIYLEQTDGWFFDQACYFVCFTGANVQMRGGSGSRNINLNLNGSFETQLLTGVDYTVEFLIPSGENTTITNSLFNINSAHAKTAYFKVTDTAAGTPGALKLRDCAIRFASQGSSGSTVPMFSSTSTITMVGEIHSGSALNLNLSALSAFSGNVYTDAPASLPAYTTTGFTVFGESSQTIQGYTRIGVGVQPAVPLHVKRNDSSTTDAFRIEQSGSGNAAAAFILTGVKSWTAGIDNADSDQFKIQSGADGFATGNVVTYNAGLSTILGNAAVSSSATDGFLYIVTCSGAPTGTPTAYTGRIPLVYDTTGNKLYIYNSGWKSATFS